MNKSRLETFSDGVLAIVITLLVLNIIIPDVDYVHFAGIRIYVKCMNKAAAEAKR